jgi:3-oxoacyl-[acyl-carrier protein] reductase
MKLKGQIAIVTGAASGIGKAIAHSLGREGAGVVVNDINLQAANAVAEEINNFKHTEAIAIAADVTKITAVKRMVAETINKYGQIDIMVCNAGGNPPSFKGRGPYEKTTFEGLSNLIDLNLKSVLICTRAIVPHMIVRGKGKIISIASICGMIGCKGSTAYSAAKAGVIGLTKSLAKELGEYGINVNCISPGSILSPPNIANPNRQEIMKKDSWLHRLEQPEVIAHAVMFLVCGEGDFITGQNLAVDGGRCLGW